MQCLKLYNHQIKFINHTRFTYQLLAYLSTITSRSLSATTCESCSPGKWIVPRETICIRHVLSRKCKVTVRNLSPTALVQRSVVKEGFRDHALRSSSFTACDVNSNSSLLRFLRFDSLGTSKRASRACARSRKPAPLTTVNECWSYATIRTQRSRKYFQRLAVFEYGVLDSRYWRMSPSLSALSGNRYPCCTLCLTRRCDIILEVVVSERCTTLLQPL